MVKVLVKNLRESDQKFEISDFVKNILGKGLVATEKDSELFKKFRTIIDITFLH